jgi:hypothetical protein
MQSADGISYLDIGDAFLRGDWSMGINAIWSPLYPLLLGLTLKLTRPATYAQFTIVHVLNFVVFIFALYCFQKLIRTLVALNSTQLIVRDRRYLPEWAIFAVGYAGFGWAFLQAIGIERVSPDMLMSAFLFWGTSLLLRISQEPERLSNYAMIGIVLALGYLAKAPMLPMFFLCLAIIWVLGGPWRKAGPRLLVATAAFALIAGPWIAALSKVKGHFTFGDSGRFNYLVHVDRVAPLWYFQNLGFARGRFVHNPRKVFDSPTIYEFATPVKGTLPVWNDPSYWSEGAVPHFQSGRQLAVLDADIHVYLEMLTREQAPLFIGFAILACLAGAGAWRLQRIRTWPAVAVGLVGLCMYLPVHSEPRYVGQFFLLVWMGLYGALYLPHGQESKRFSSIVVIVVALAMIFPLVISAIDHGAQALKGPPHTHWIVAQQLRRMGVSPGDRVGRIGGRVSVAWARLLGVSVVGEVPRDEARDFWYATPEVQAAAIQEFRKLGVKALVAEQIPPYDVYRHGTEWIPLADGEFYALRLLPTQ